MPCFVEVRTSSGTELVALDRDRLTVGKDPANDIVLRADASVSRMHAVVERYAAGWSIRDLDSRNGTFLNGERVRTERPLHHRDEIRIGKTRLVFRADVDAQTSATEATQAPPRLTHRERDVLIALCRPMMAGDVFTEPASLREIAEELFVTETAVKQHLFKLYDKFEIPHETQRRRVRLANEAIRRGAVTYTDLVEDGTP